MEPPTADQLDDLQTIAMPFTWRHEKIEVAASYVANCVREVAHYVRVASCFLLKVTCLAYGLSIYLLQCLSLCLAEILREVVSPILRNMARYAETIALMLESANGHTARGRPPSRVISRGRGVRPPAESITEEIISVASSASDVTESDDEESEVVSDAYGPRYRWVSRGTKTGGAVEDAYLAKISTKRQVGMERIRAFREKRRQKGLKL